MCLSPRLCLPAWPQTSSHLPRSPKPGIHSPCGPQRVPPPGGRPGHWMDGRETQPAGLGRCVLFKNTRGDEGPRCIQEKVRGCCGARRRGNATGLGHTVVPGGCLESPRCRGTRQHPHTGPAIPSRGHLATATRDVKPVAPKHSAPRRPASSHPAPAPPSRAAADSRPLAAALASPVEEGRTQACARELPGGGPAAPLEDLSPLSASPNP